MGGQVYIGRIFFMDKQINKPLVSIIMPVYNGEEFVGEAVESILRQTYNNIELIVVDDASTDATFKILSEYKKRYPKKVQLIRLKRNRGKGGDPAANIAYKKVRGEFVARMDADDIALPDRIEKQVNFMLKHPEYAVLGTNAHVINVDGEVVGEKKMPQTSEEIYNGCFVLHPMINPTQMFRRSLINDPQDLYMEDNPTNNDYLTSMRRISQGARYYNLPEKLIYYRIHDKNDSLARVKKTFRNSLVTRARAVYEFGYRPSLSSLAKFTGQIFLVYVLPEKVVFQLYLLVKGIVKPADYLPAFRLPLFGRLKKALSSSV